MPDCRTRSRSRPNLMWRLHRTQGLGVRPRRYSSGSSPPRRPGIPAQAARPGAGSPIASPRRALTRCRGPHPARSSRTGLVLQRQRAVPHCMVRPITACPAREAGRPSRPSPRRAQSHGYGRVCRHSPPPIPPAASPAAGRSPGRSAGPRHRLGRRTNTPSCASRRTSSRAEPEPHSRLPAGTSCSSGIVDPREIPRLGILAVAQPHEVADQHPVRVLHVDHFPGAAGLVQLSVLRGDRVDHLGFEVKRQEVALLFLA